MVLQSVAVWCRAEPGIGLSLRIPGVEKVKGVDPPVVDQTAPGGVGDGFDARTRDCRHFNSDSLDAGADGAEREARFCAAIEHSVCLGVGVLRPGGSHHFPEPCTAAMGCRAGSAEKAHSDTHRFGRGERAQSMVKIMHDDGGWFCQVILAKIIMNPSF